MMFREFVERVKESVEKIGADFDDPEDDWMPVVQLETPAGMVLAVIDPAFFDGADRKDELAEQLALAAKMSKATKVAMVTSSWMAKLDPGMDRDDWPAPSEHPDRIEVVMVTVMDAERSEGWCAEIQRDGENPPTLADWVDYGTALEGRFIDAIAPALR